MNIETWHTFNISLLLYHSKKDSYGYQKMSTEIAHKNAATNMPLGRQALVNNIHRTRYS